MPDMPAWLDKYAKAVVGLLITAYGLYQAAKGVDTPGGAGVTSDEWVTIAVTSIFTGFGVWAIPNAKQPLMPTTVVADKVVQPIVTMTSSTGTATTMPTVSNHMPEVSEGKHAFDPDADGDQHP